MNFISDNCMNTIFSLFNELQASRQGEVTISLYVIGRGMISKWMESCVICQEVMHIDLELQL